MVSCTIGNIDSFHITWWPWKPVQLMATLIDYILIPIDLWTIVHAHAFSIDLIPSDPEVSKWNQSRWPSNCTGFYGHHVMWKESILADLLHAVLTWSGPGAAHLRGSGLQAPRRRIAPASWSRFARKRKISTISLCSAVENGSFLLEECKRREQVAEESEESEQQKKSNESKQQKKSNESNQQKKIKGRGKHKRKKMRNRTEKRQARRETESKQAKIRTGTMQAKEKNKAREKLRWSESKKLERRD